MFMVRKVANRFTTLERERGLGQVNFRKDFWDYNEGQEKNWLIADRCRPASLRSKRFRVVSEQRKTEERDFRFWPREK